jgi:ATP-dependent exoDNAse (exonuclease V) alpha subunit
MGVINGVLDPECQLMCLQGAAGTGKTFTIATLVSMLRAQDRNCLICATTGIAAVQYPGGCTLHSLFKLGIDEESRGGLVSHIGHGSVHGDYILRADLIVIDEVSMLTPWVANRVPATLQCIASN